jgi:hypothetical protein
VRERIMNKELRIKVNKGKNKVEEKGKENK